MIVLSQWIVSLSQLLEEAKINWVIRYFMVSCSGFNTVLLNLLQLLLYMLLSIRNISVSKMTINNVLNASPCPYNHMHIQPHYSDVDANKQR